MIWINIQGNTLTANAAVPEGYISVKIKGAKGNGVNDDTKAIRESIAYAFEHNLSGVYFPSGTYLIKEAGVKAGILKLFNGVSLKGAGTKVCHILLSPGRMNPNSLFYQDWQHTPFVSNVIVEGIDFNGNSYRQKFAPEYQFCHALSINNGGNIIVRNCKFQQFRGDGLLFGDTFETTLNARIVTNVIVHHNEFADIYREGAMFCCVNGAKFFNNYVHGNGYLVGGVDIERHGPNEAVKNVSVHDNLFRFTDGYGPAERGRVIKYRRAVTIGYFYDGYPNGAADSLSGEHQVYNNTIYQGQIDCFGHINVNISNNKILNTFENIKGVKFVSPPAINVADAGKTTGLKNVRVSGNNIQSAIPGNGISFYNYSGIIASKNILRGALLGKIALVESTGKINANNYYNSITPNIKHKIK